MSEDLNIRRTPWGLWVEFQSKILAGLVKGSFEPEGALFATEDHFRLQVAIMKRPLDHVIQPHVHIGQKRIIYGTQEILVIKQGRMIADLYSDSREYLVSLTAEKGDILILNYGGHGFEMEEECVFIEVKQGPFNPNLDKELFSDPRQSPQNRRLVT